MTVQIQVQIESPLTSPSIELVYSASQENDVVDPLANWKPREFPKEEPFDLFTFIALYLSFALVLLTSFHFIFGCVANTSF